MSLTPANDIYPALPQGTQPSTAMNSYQLTLSRQEQAIFNYVSTTVAATGVPVKFNSSDEYNKFIMATYAFGYNPNRL